MARNPSADPRYAAFAALFDGHLRAGTGLGLRPTDPETWTDVAFAKLIPGRDGQPGSSANRISNWRKGTALPDAIEPLLRALFGPLRTDGGQALRSAWLAAKLPAAREALIQSVPGLCAP